MGLALIEKSTNNNPQSLSAPKILQNAFSHLCAGKVKTDSWINIAHGPIASILSVLKTELWFTGRGDGRYGGVRIQSEET